MCPLERRVLCDSSNLPNNNKCSITTPRNGIVSPNPVEALALANERLPIVVGRVESRISRRAKLIAGTFILEMPVECWDQVTLRRGAEDGEIRDDQHYRKLGGLLHSVFVSELGLSRAYRCFTTV